LLVRRHDLSLQVVDAIPQLEKGVRNRGVAVGRPSRDQPLREGIGQPRGDPRIGILDGDLDDPRDADRTDRDVVRELAGVAAGPDFPYGLDEDVRTRDDGAESEIAAASASAVGSAASMETRAEASYTRCSRALTSSPRAIPASKQAASRPLWARKMRATASSMFTAQARLGMGRFLYIRTSSYLRATAFRDVP
jgi:hypothetical protein